MLLMLRKLSVLAFLGFASSISAKTLTCTADPDQNGRGWIPSEFSINIAEDRKSAEVLVPKRKVFGEKPFRKGLFGETLWSRGSGISNLQENYSYTLQLDFYESDSRYRVRIDMQGYSPLSVKGRCASHNDLALNEKRDGRSAQVAAQKSCSFMSETGNLIYAYLKLGLTDPNSVIPDLNANPLIEKCINAARGSFPTIRQFIIDKLYQRPLSASDCRNVKWRDLNAFATLSDVSEEFRNAWDGSQKKAVYEWCDDIFD